MNNLKLITTETFGDLSCNFYRNMNDDILLTREQIGQALKYADPQKAIDNIHSKHKDRLNDLSVTTKLRATDGKCYNTMIYTEREIMEICRWSRQPKANLFMDWVWDVIEAYRHNKLTPQINMTPLTQAITTLTQSMTQMQQDINTLKESTQTQTKTLPIKKNSRWKTNTFDKLRLLTDYANEHSDQELKLSDTLHITINEMQDTYDIDLTDYTNEYMLIHSLETKPYALDIIEYYKDIKTLYNQTLNSIMDSLNLTEPVHQNIFQVLAQNMA